MNSRRVTISVVVVVVFIAAVFAVTAVWFNPADSLRREALAGKSVLLAENVAIESTAGRRQSNIIRTLAASTDKGALEPLTVEYPFDRSMFPPEFIPPMFIWEDTAENADTWLIEVTFSGDTGRIYALAPDNPLPAPEIDQACYDLTEEDNPPYPPYQPASTNWTPDDAMWECIKKKTAGQFATVTFYGFHASNPERVISKGSVKLCTSEDPVDAPIFYRDVPMIGIKRKLEDELAGVIQPIPTQAQDIIKWRLRDVSKRESRVVLEDMPTCANCHSFSADGSTMGMDIDGPAGDKGGYAIAGISQNMTIDKQDIISWNYSYRDKFKARTKTIGFLSQMSPDGRYAMTTLNEMVFVSNYRDHKFIQVFYPTRGYLGFYSKDLDDIMLLPGADDPKYVHCDPTWTPDGESLVFARATARANNIEGQPRPLYANDPNETPIRYDLCRIPFNSGKGGKPALIEGASANGTSNTFPKISPDGKWIVFVKCNNGQLMRPDSRLWIVPAGGGEAREMRCNLSLMNSWHTFSPNSRWMAFSSKGISPYTQMFLTHIDENGNDTPAILVPNTTAPNRAVNIPEFVNVAYDDFRNIDVPAVEFYRHHKRAVALGDQGRFKEALAELRMALAEEPDDIRVSWELHYRTGLILQKFGDDDGAIEHWLKAIETDPRVSSDPYYLIGITYANRKEYAKSLDYLKQTVELAPKHTRAIYYLSKLHIEDEAPELRDPVKALSYARKANELTFSREPIMLELLASAYAANDRFKEAVTTAESALEYARPRGIDEHIKRIEGEIALFKQGKAN